MYLEWLAHNGLSVSGFSYNKFSIEVPEELIIQFHSADLPARWQSTPVPQVNRDFAKNYFYSRNEYLAMKIPSVMVPEEWNLVINPLHTAFSKIQNSIQFLGKFIAPNR